jgi:hypothetical protein
MVFQYLRFNPSPGSSKVSNLKPWVTKWWGSSSWVALVPWVQQDHTSVLDDACHLAVFGVKILAEDMPGHEDVGEIPGKGIWVSVPSLG